MRGTGRAIRHAHETTSTSHAQVVIEGDWAAIAGALANTEGGQKRAWVGVGRATRGDGTSPALLQRDGPDRRARDGPETPYVCPRIARLASSI